MLSKILFSLYFLLKILSTLSQVLPEIVEPQHEQYYELLVKTGVLKKHSLTKYIVSIKYQDHETSYAESHLCTGVIITKWAVVTSAHCLLDENFNEINLENILIMGGFTYGSIFDKDLQKRSVKQTILHPDFKRTTFTHDVAILVVNDTFNFFKDQIEQVEITKSSIAAYAECSVLGFGVLNFKDSKLTEILEQGLIIWPQDACGTYLKKHNIHSVGKFCAGNIQNRKDPPCIGLASEPLLCKDIVAGISLFNIGCNIQNGFAAVYSDLSYYSSWIKEHVDGTVLFTNSNMRCTISKLMIGLSIFISIIFM